MSFWKKAYANKKKIFIYGTGSLSALLIFLASLSFYGVKVATSGNIYCKGTSSNPCISYFNITLQNYSLCLPSFNGIQFDDENKIKSFEIYKLQNDWVKYNLSKGQCLDTGMTHQFKIVGYKTNPVMTVKWGVGYGIANADPLWKGIPPWTIRPYSKESKTVSNNWKINTTAKDGSWVTLEPFIVYMNVNRTPLQTRILFNSNGIKYNFPILNNSKFLINISIPKSKTLFMKRFEYLGFKIESSVPIKKRDISIVNNFIKIGDVGFDFNDVILNNFTLILNETYILIGNVTNKTDIYIDPYVFDAAVDNMNFCALTNMSVFGCYDDEGDDALMCGTWWTNGTTMTAPWVVDGTLSSTNMEGVAVVCWDGTDASVFWDDAPSNQLKGQTWNNVGVNLTPILVLATCGDSGTDEVAVSACRLSATKAEVCHDNEYTDKGNCQTINRTMVIDIDKWNFMALNDGNYDSQSVSCLSDSSFINCYTWSPALDDVCFASNISGAAGNIWNLSIDSGSGVTSIISQTLLNGGALMGYCFDDEGDEDLDFGVINTTTNASICAATFETTLESADQDPVTAFYIGGADQTWGCCWNDATDSDISCALTNRTCQIKYSAYDIDTASVAGEGFVSAVANISGDAPDLCDGKWLLAWENSTSGVYQGYNDTTVTWDGTCGDTTTTTTTVSPDCWTVDDVNKRIIIPANCYYPTNTFGSS